MCYRKIVGTCSECRGPVYESFGLGTKILVCASCGATKQEDYGPVIDMTPSRFCCTVSYSKEGERSRFEYETK